MNCVATSTWIIKITLCATQNLESDGILIVEYVIVLKASCSVIFLNVADNYVSYV